MSSTHSTSDERFRLLNLASSQRSAGEAGGDSRSGHTVDHAILLGESVAVRRMRSQIQRIAPYLRTALIRGDNGSGKQMVARALHAHSPGSGGPFVAARAGELAVSLLESARGGTLYLGGVGELSFGLQELLFRFLLARDERRVGMSPSIGQDRETRRRDTRILASSDRDLRMLTVVGQFRRDLYARLAAVEILVPPLRQRLEDIPALAAWLLQRLAEDGGQLPRILSGTTVAQLQGRMWPDNLRELEHVLTHAAALAEGGLIEPHHLPGLTETVFSASSAAQEVKMECLNDVMMRHVLDVLTGCNGNKLRAAQVLGISRSTLYRMLGARAADHPLA